MSTDTGTVERVRNRLALDTDNEWPSVVRERLVAYALLSLYVFVVWFPIYYIFITSIQPTAEVLSLPVNFVPQQVTGAN